MVYNGFSLLPTKEEDIPKIAELERKAFSMPESEKSLRESLDSDMALYFTAFDGDAFVGYITSYVSFETADIISVAVEPECRGKGYGRRILEGFADECGKKGLEKITLEVRASNLIAISLYESLGFVKVGVRKGYYEKPREDGILYDLRVISNSGQ